MQQKIGESGTSVIIDTAIFLNICLFGKNNLYY
jgi:hypothetical protein